MRLLLLMSLLCTVALGETYRAVKGGVPRFSLKEQGTWAQLEVPGRYRVWIERSADRSKVSRYLVQEGTGPVREYRHEVTGEAVLPSMSPWDALWPKETADGGRHYLGHDYVRENNADIPFAVPAEVRVVLLRPDLWLGPPSNTRQVDERRRYDTSDYTYVPLKQADYGEMAEAGITCVKAVGEQQQWAEELGLLYWGPHERLPYPELLYRSQYLGPALFLDEPAVGTRDHDLRPRLAKDAEYRRAMNPQEALRAYQEHYAKTLATGAPQVLMRTLAARADVDLGAMRFPQQNIYNWETMPSTAAWAMSQAARVPSAMVFEPPGRIGTRRTLPEWNMSYGTRFAADDMRVLPAVVFGFLRSAARLNRKSWGVSIYGAVERADAYWWLTHAYDLGAERFFFWDNYQLACVPFGEVLELSRHLRRHAREHPRRELGRLHRAAERLILLPPGYDLGHVQMGRGNLWGIAELNLERVNRHGVKYREVMSHFFQEIERALREGVAFDLAWDLPGLNAADYRQVVRIREAARFTPEPAKDGPRLTVEVRDRVAVAEVEERLAPVYYTLGADPDGVRHNAMVLWELYGPREEDYEFLLAKEMRPRVRSTGGTAARVEISLPEQLKPGKYRLRAATVDTAGRSTIVWTEFTIQ